jgi:hypothetical protein
MKDWNENEIACACSKGGVIVTAHPFDNLIKAGCPPVWPPSEIVQKLYQSRQVRAFAGDDLVICTSGLGYYCDLQSIHSEDAITWSVFGAAARAPQSVLEHWLDDLFTLIDLPRVRAEHAEIFLWRRIPHPDNLVSGGPEIDVGISTANALILCEAKWLSGVGSAQGKEKDKDQIQLRGEFLKNYGSKVYPNQPELVVVGIGLFHDAFVNTAPEPVIFRSITWGEVCSLASHPMAEEVERYFKWKKSNSNGPTIRLNLTARSDALFSAPSLARSG